MSNKDQPTELTPENQALLKAIHNDRRLELNVLDKSPWRPSTFAHYAWLIAAFSSISGTLYFAVTNTLETISENSKRSIRNEQLIHYHQTEDTEIHQTKAQKELQAVQILAPVKQDISDIKSDIRLITNAVEKLEKRVDK